MLYNKNFETYLHSKSDNTRKAYFNKVEAYLNWCSTKKKKVDQQSAIEYIALIKDTTGATKNQVIASIRAYFKSLGLPHSMIECVPKNPKKRLHLSLEETNRLLSARLGKNTPLGKLYDLRNQIIIRLMLKSGLRVGEVVPLKVSDIDTDKRTVQVRGKHVKRNKERLTFLDSNTANLLKEYISFGKFSGELFSVGESGIRKVFKTYARKAGISDDYSPHCLRHTFAITFMQGGGEISKLSVLLGHTDIGTTTIYLNYTNSELQSDFDKYIT